MEDLIDALIISAIKDEAVGKIYNLGASDTMSLNETAEIMCQILKGGSFKSVPFPEDRKSIDVGDFVCDYSLFSSTFGWKPKIKFEDGIKWIYQLF